ncbi:MAG: nuclear transport factor 2 family protein [Gemmatimonadota bacterium]
MSIESEVLASEQRFFTGLLEADLEALDSVLTSDFLLVDVFSGSIISREALLAVVGSRQLRFTSMHLVDALVRVHGSSAIVTGHTEMTGQFDDQPLAASSRYTHIFVSENGRWRLASAQGTPIAPVKPLPG